MSDQSMAEIVAWAIAEGKARSELNPREILTNFVYFPSPLGLKAAEYTIASLNAAGYQIMPKP